MKTFKKSYLPDFINYNGEKYTFNATITGATNTSNTTPKKVIEALKTTGKKGVLVEVLSNRLKGVTDLHGKQYKPSQFIFTNEQQYKIFEGYDHFKSVPLFQVLGVNNEYVGEWNETREEAHEEIKNLLN